MQMLQSTGPMFETRSRLSWVMIVGCVQAIAAVYFLIDGIDDIAREARQGIGLEVMMDCIVAASLLAGLAVATVYAKDMSKQLRRQERSLAVARGALAKQIAIRFEEWGLTSGEAEVALFAMKGCSIADISRLRGAAPGTVRSQLSQVYAKAGVGSQSMLVSLFIEDLIDVPGQG